MQEYSEKHVHFIDFSLPKLLEEFLNSFIEKVEDFSILDLGCGDGRLLYAMYKKGLLRNAERVVGIDISETRISRLKKTCPFAEGIVADACNLKHIPDNSFDIAVSSQVIEHVSNDRHMLKEVYRILKPGGVFYISSVIKKWYGFWIYWNNGFKLDPTHVREYRSPEEFLNLLKSERFQIMRWETNKVSYPILDLMLRGLIKVGLVKASPDFYLKHQLLAKIRNLIKIRVIGYQTIEALVKVRK